MASMPPRPPSVHRPASSSAGVCGWEGDMRWAAAVVLRRAAAAASHGWGSGRQPAGGGRPAGSALLPALAVRCEGTPALSCTAHPTPHRPAARPPPAWLALCCSLPAPLVASGARGGRLLRPSRPSRPMTTRRRRPCMSPRPRRPPQHRLCRPPPSPPPHHPRTDKHTLFLCAPLHPLPTVSRPAALVGHLTPSPLNPLPFS